MIEKKKMRKLKRKRINFKLHLLCNVRIHDVNTAISYYTYLNPLQIYDFHAFHAIRI